MTAWILIDIDNFFNNDEWDIMTSLLKKQFRRVDVGGVYWALHSSRSLCSLKTCLWNVRCTWRAADESVGYSTTQPILIALNFTRGLYVDLTIFRPGNGSPCATMFFFLLLLVLRLFHFTTDRRQTSHIQYILVTIFSRIAQCRIFKLSPN